MGKYQHWGVAVRPGETLKCDPGDFCCHISLIALQTDKGNEDVRVFVKVDGNQILIGTLSVEKCPQCAFDLVYEKEFELLHTSKTSSISVIGYKFWECARKSYSDASTGKDDESDEEVPLAIPLYPNADDDKNKETKSSAEKPAATEFCKPKNTETKDPEKLKADVGGTHDDDSDEDYADSEDGESGDDHESAMGKNRPAETPLKTPPEKEAKVATPSIGNKTDAGNGTPKRSGYIHVATPYPSSKQVKKTPSIIDSSKQSTGYSCKSCSKTFHSSIALETHCKVKHSAHNK